MQQWEHRFIEVTPVVRPKDPRKIQFQAQIMKLGEEGWELVSVFPDADGLWAAFKRPVEAAPATPSGPQMAARPRGPVGRHNPDQR